MKTLLMVFLSVLVWALPVFAQDPPPVDDDPLSPEFGGVLPPPELRNWSPEAGQFQLYVSFDGNADSLPRIDILSSDASWPFAMEKIGDTVYIFIVPPGYALKSRSVVDGLENEFPFVVWAGTQRSVFWFSYDSGKVGLDTLQPAPFISVVPIKPLPERVLTLQLQGTGKNAKLIKTLLADIDDKAAVIQLDNGYWENIWGRVSKSVVQRWKVNETTFGTLVVLQYAEGQREAVDQVLRKYRGGEYAAH